MVRGEYRSAGHQWVSDDAPPATGAVGIEERVLQVEVDDLVLSGGIFLAEDARVGVLLLHGIPSNSPADPGDEGYPGLARALAEQGISAAWLNMRAAKGQPGFFSIQGWVRDAAATVSLLKRREFHDLRVVIVGSSAGGAVAAQVASLGLAVDAVGLLAAPADWISFAAHPEAGVERITQDSGMAVAPDVLADPSAWGAEFIEVSTQRAIARVDVPVLIVHGDDDEVVPVDHATKLSQSAPHADVRILEGGSHQLRKDPRAIKEVVEWLGRTFS